MITGDCEGNGWPLGPDNSLLSFCSRYCLPSHIAIAADVSAILNCIRRKLIFPTSWPFLKAVEKSGLVLRVPSGIFKKAAALVRNDYKNKGISGIQGMIL